MASPIKRGFFAIGRFFKKMWFYVWNILRAVWRIILGLGTVKGLLALFISFTIYYGWAVALIVIGTIYAKYQWMMAVGMSVIVFWAGPFTPFFPILIITTLFIQRYILRDKKTQSFTEIYKQYLGESKMSEEDERLLEKIDEVVDDDYLDFIESPSLEIKEKGEKKDESND